MAKTKELKKRRGAYAKRESCFVSFGSRLSRVIERLFFQRGSAGPLGARYMGARVRDIEPATRRPTSRLFMADSVARAYRKRKPKHHPNNTSSLRSLNIG